MAKWGEGDPRWIVEERPDATNVNNWHWSEKNASGWSKEKLKSLFEGLELEEPGLAKVTIKEISKCDGEAMVNNRKGKLIFFYEWDIKMDWVAKKEDEPKKDIKGHIQIPNLSEENEPSEIDVSVSLTTGGSAGDDVKEFLRKKGEKVIQSKVADYITALKREYATDLILPTKGQAVTKQSKTILSPPPSENSLSANVTNTTNNMQKMGLGCKMDTSQITLTERFKCTADDIYRALTVREMVVAFTRGDVKLDVVKGGKFELFGGNISGEYENIEPNKQIVQKWRFKTWPSGHFSTVTLDIQQKEDSTEVRLTQSGIPSSDVDRTKEGWKNYFWDSIKRTFGFGAMLI
ncbi:activator of 90 kDa heat shock protein ATPase homolog 1-like [Penaeus japonicus]|uniref:activator of 90 kDa heat shock protein ATPase homolog 1-like n=1 Tax=Penaeus japonicus TaxID=27405 RepID=UPI001C717785|nr:activator of 90 kDa heat shock protein ATPase homolog 1-like [Penaeus japonicus]